MQFSISQSANIAALAREAISVAQAWDLLPLGSGLLDQDMCLIFSNSALQKMVCRSEQQLKGKEFFSLLNIELQTRSTIGRELNQYGCWNGMVFDNNKVLRIDISREELNSNILTYPFIISDYTKDYNQLAELRAAKILAEKTDRAKSRFLSNMSHELRTPLNAIVGFAQLMQVNAELSEIQQDNLKEIEDAGTYLLSLINEILDLSRIEAGKILLNDESISLDQLFHDCINLVRPLADKRRINVNYQLDTNKLLQNDHIRLKQVLINLLSNAIKYNRSEGSVSVYCCETDANTIHIEIRDSGPGIKSELQSNIFSPFERLGADEKKIEGSGIGLMISRQLMQLMGGKIGLLSEPDRGSVFWIELPSAHAKLNNSNNNAGSFSATLPGADPDYRHVISIGLANENIDLLKRCLTLRRHIELNACQNLQEAITCFIPHRPRCVFLSPAMAHELSMDSRNLLMLKNLDVVVVENYISSDSAQVDHDLFKTVLRRQHSLHELLELLDRFCSNQ